ncbi:S8/S53 family peptidase [Clostridiaceae bacterium M8S5]|nr:S8/S53 family peptidase [Clostridiaceae bacterium M8S5]
MKRILCLFVTTCMLLTGCNSPKMVDRESSKQIQEQSSGLNYETILSKKGELNIVRKPKAYHYSGHKYAYMTELPKYNPDLKESWQVDLRSRNLTNLNLKDELENLIYADFNSKTQWPDKLPEEFDPKLIMELGKNPGLEIRELHKKGITGKGIGITILDQSLLVDHIEYKDQLKLYEEIHWCGGLVGIHGPAVASIAVGKNVGVAPEANLYYIAEDTAERNEEGEIEYDLTWIAKSIDRIVEINKTLSKEEKIRVISISLGINENMKCYEKALKSIEKAKLEGIYTIYVGSAPFRGLGRNPLKNADDIKAYSKGEYWNGYYENKDLLVPMDSRCFASNSGDYDYMFNRNGGESWSTPYVAGLYALACQVDPDITPETFWKVALSTGDTITDNNSESGKLGKIVNPTKLMGIIEQNKSNGSK